MGERVSQLDLILERYRKHIEVVPVPSIAKSKSAESITLPFTTSIGGPECGVRPFRTPEGWSGLTHEEYVKGLKNNQFLDAFKALTGESWINEDEEDP